MKFLEMYLDRRRNVILDRVVSLVNIPFEIQHTGSPSVIRWTESSNVTQRVYLVFGLFILGVSFILAFVTLYGFYDPSMIVYGFLGQVVLTLLTPVGFAMAGFFFLNRMAIRNLARVLEIEVATKTARIIVRCNRQIEPVRIAECDITSLDFFRSPAKLRVGNKRWVGVVLGARIDEEMIVIACQKTSEKIQKYERTLPEKVRSLIVSSDTPLKKAAIQ